MVLKLDPPSSLPTCAWRSTAICVRPPAKRSVLRTSSANSSRSPGPHGEQAMDRAQGPELGRLAEAHPGHVSGDDGAGGLVEVPAVLGRARTRRGQQGVEQHVDVAHREALVLADERERVVGGADHLRHQAPPEILPVLPDHAEGVDEHGPPAHLAAAARGDAIELAARIDGDGGAVEAAALGREQVEGDEGALPGAGRGDGDGRALEGPADQGRVPPLAPLAEQDAPALGQLAHGAPVQKRGPAVEVGLRAPAALAAGGLLDHLDCRPAPEQGQHRDGCDREHQHDQPELFQPQQPVQGGVGPLDLPDGAHDAGPERRGGDREARAVEPEADPASGALASGRVVGRERRRGRERESGGGDVVRPVAGGEPDRPASACGEQEGADGQFEGSHLVHLPKFENGACMRRPRHGRVRRRGRRFGPGRLQHRLRCETVEKAREQRVRFVECRPH